MKKHLTNGAARELHHAEGEKAFLPFAQTMMELGRNPDDLMIRWNDLVADELPELRMNNDGATNSFAIFDGVAIVPDATTRITICGASGTTRRLPTGLWRSW